MRGVLGHFGNKECGVAIVDWDDDVSIVSKTRALVILLFRFYQYSIRCGIRNENIDDDGSYTEVSAMQDCLPRFYVEKKKRIDVITSRKHRLMSLSVAFVIKYSKGKKQNPIEPVKNYWNNIIVALRGTLLTKRVMETTFNIVE